MFGLGMQEILVLLILAAMFACVVALVVFFARRKPNS